MTANGWGALAGDAELIWHRANERSELDAFLASGVRWVECDARMDGAGAARVSHRPLREQGLESPMELSSWLSAIRSAERNVKIDLKEDGPTLSAALEEVDRLGFEDHSLWFNAAIEVPGRAGWKQIANSRPGARLSCPLDTLAPYLLETPAATYPILDELASWGIDWVSIGVCVPQAARLVAAMRDRGWSINVWDVENDEDRAGNFLRVGRHHGRPRVDRTTEPIPDQVIVPGSRVSLEDAGIGFRWIFQDRYEPGGIYPFSLKASLIRARATSRS